MSMDFDELDRLLRRSGAPVDAAECHGSLCGALCAPDGGADAWLARTLDGVADARAVHAPLLRLAGDTRRALAEGALEFTPLLPDDDAPLAARTQALGEWCEGFLFGVGSARIEKFDAQPESVQEVIRDLVEIARIGLPAGDDPEGDEAAYAELVEYLRVGTQLVFDELTRGPE